MFGSGYPILVLLSSFIIEREGIYSRELTVLRNHSPFKTHAYYKVPITVLDIRYAMRGKQCECYGIRLVVLVSEDHQSENPLNE